MIGCDCRKSATSDSGSAFLNRLANFFHRRRARIQLEKVPLRRAAAQLHQPRPRQTPRATSSCAARCSCCPTCGPAPTPPPPRRENPARPTLIVSPALTCSRISRSSPTATESAVSACASGISGASFTVAVVRIFRRVDGLDRHQHRRRIAPPALLAIETVSVISVRSTPAGQSVQRRDSADRVGIANCRAVRSRRHHRASFAGQHAVETLAESAHAGQRAHARRHRQHHEQKLGH